jgi:hypothetical protein
MKLAQIASPEFELNDKNQESVTRFREKILP